MVQTLGSKYLEPIDYNDPKFNGAELSADWIRDLESSDSRIHKERVIEKALMAARLGSAAAQAFLFNCYQAYNPYYVFGVKQVPETRGLTNRPNPWPKFWALLESLRTRSVTGGNARAAIESVSQEFDSDNWNNMCARVIRKDLRCGISEKTINKVVGNSEWCIPVFSCQLAQDSGDNPRKMKGLKRLECKLDGVRVLAICYAASQTVNLFSRNGKEFANFEHVERELIPLIPRLSLAMFGNTSTDFVLDGEITGKSFQALMKQAQRKRDANAADSQYYVFDVMPREDFYRGFWNAQQHKRTAKLDKIGPLLKEHAASVHVMPGMDVDLDTSEGHSKLEQFAEAAVAQGYEGIMIKEVGAPYECKRSSFWMKWKPTITVDLEIVGFETGTGRNLNRLGAIICEGDDNGRRICVNVGSGLSDSDRDEFWSKRDLLLGRVVEVQADAVTQNQDGSYSLRFPRFLRFRGFESGEKL